jgi:hypothetical protein
MYRDLSLTLMWLIVVAVMFTAMCGFTIQFANAVATKGLP